jgi:lactate racemase
MILGRGSVTGMLGEAEVSGFCEDAFSRKKIDDRRILVIIPDSTRSGPIDMMFRVVYRLLAKRVKTLDFLIALGTHPPMNDEEIYIHLGITKEEHVRDYPKARFFNHESMNPDKLKQIVSLSEDEISEFSCGLLRRKVDVTINKMIFDYDMLLIIGPTFPHETMGFSGGNKYFFPGICGEELIDTFHWLGALLTIPAVIGTKDTPMRRLINRAAQNIPIERMCISLVVNKHDLHGIFIGQPEETFSAAADVSEKIHIIFKDRPFKKVLSCPSPMYTDIWTGGKGMVKVEGVVADGGEIILYSPAIKEASATYGNQLEEIGYHCRDYFLKQWDRFRDYPGNVIAQSCNVRGLGTFENGVEKPRINVVLATSIKEETCRKLNFDYLDPRTIHIDEWKNREDEGILFVPNAGETLYLLKNNPFRKCP